MGALFHALPLPPHWRVYVHSLPSCCFHTATRISHITWFLQDLSPLSCPDACYSCVFGTFRFTSADNDICALDSSGHSQRTLSKLGVWALRISRQCLLSSIFYEFWIVVGIWTQTGQSWVLCVTEWTVNTGDLSGMQTQEQGSDWQCQVCL